MKLPVLGTGQMGQALVQAILSRAVLPPSAVVLYDVRTEKSRELAESWGCQAADSGPAAVSGADAVLLAVKPQVMRTVLEELAGDLKADALLISIAAVLPSVSCGLRRTIGRPGAGDAQYASPDWQWRQCGVF
jgi:pyrroline-5-carboxylate reductase